MITELRNEVNDFLNQRFGIYSESSTLTIHDDNSWNAFCERGSYEKSANGLYLPKSLSAHIRDSEFVAQNLFHELFGHGLFVEKSLIGKLVRENKDKRFYNEYEGFALWIEWYLSNLVGCNEIFEKRFNKFQPQETELFRRMADHFLEFGDYNLLYTLGFEKHYDTNVLRDILSKMYRNKEMKFALAYGSKKPFADIDFFIVSDEIHSFTNHWLDVYAIKEEDFDFFLSRLDISITDPLFSGEFVMGDRNYFERCKQRIEQEEISEDAIAYHKNHVGKTRVWASRYPENSPERFSCQRYGVSYELNASELSLGRKPKTLGEIKRIYPDHFEALGEKPRLGGQNVLDR